MQALTNDATWLTSAAAILNQSIQSLAAGQVTIELLQQVKSILPGLSQIEANVTKTLVGAYPQVFNAASPFTAGQIVTADGNRFVVLAAEGNSVTVQQQ